jgi:two-component system, NarL family, nitrate/nitrite response regulator NarL
VPTHEGIVRVRVLLADSHRLLREVLAQFLAQKLDAHVHEAATLPDALQHLTHQGRFDLILLSVDAPAQRDLDLVKAIVAAAPGSAVGLMTSQVSAGLAMQSMALGVRGMLPKTLRAQALLDALRLMLAGEAFLPAAMAVAADGGSDDTALREASLRRRLGDVTARELEVLRLVARGLTNRQVGGELGLTEATVKLHLYRVFEKTGARNRADAVRLFFEASGGSSPSSIDAADLNKIHYR